MWSARTPIRASSLAVAVALLLAGCAETQLMVHTAKQLTPPPDERALIGTYKVGSPYEVSGIVYRPEVDYTYSETGIASWYGPGFHAKTTANGAIFDQNTVTGAHRTLPLPSKVQVTNLENGRSISVIINDRGPFARGRIIDLSRRSAQLLGFDRKGTAKVKVDIIPEESRILAVRAGADATVIARQPGPGADAPVAVAARLPRAGEAPAAVPATPTAVEVVEAMEPKMSTHPVRPTAIFVQAGAFSQADNADRLRSRLAPLGPTRISRAVVDGRSFYRVRLGPVPSVAEGDRLLSRVIDSGHPTAQIVVEQE